MERIEVSSTNLKSIGYDPHSRTLEIEFKRGGSGGSVYQYSGVPHEVWTHFLHSPSKGTYFSREVKGNYRAQKIG